MTAHLDVESLSTYLDRELSSGESRRIEEHLELCDDCRERLWSLEKVVADLQRLNRLAPPLQMGIHLSRLAALQSSEFTLAQRLEKSLGRFTYQSSILPLFAIVVALILIIYMLSWGVHRRATGGLPVDLEPPAVQTQTLGITMSRQVSGRSFHRVGVLWIEEGLEEVPVDERVSVTDPRGQELLSAVEGLAEMAAPGERVRLHWQDRIVEIRFDAP